MQLHSLVRGLAWAFEMSPGAQLIVFFLVYSEQTSMVILILKMSMICKRRVLIPKMSRNEYKYSFFDMFVGGGANGGLVTSSNGNPTLVIKYHDQVS